MLARIEARNLLVIFFACGWYSKTSSAELKEMALQATLLIIGGLQKKTKRRRLSITALVQKQNKSCWNVLNIRGFFAYQGERRKCAEAWKVDRINPDKIPARGWKSQGKYPSYTTYVGKK